MFNRILFFIIFLCCIFLVFTVRYKSVRIFEFKFLDSCQPDRFYVPVSINGNTYKFLFDTGASRTVIDSALAEKIGLTVFEKKYIKTTFTEGVAVFDSVGYTSINYAIGNIHSKQTVLLFGQEKSEKISSVDFDATLGMDIIKQFNWLFDFSKGRAIISKSKIDFQTLPDDKILTFDFYYTNSSDNTRMNLSIDGQLFHNALFDTGYRKYFLLSEKSKGIDIKFSEQGLATYSNKPMPAFWINTTDERKAIFIDSMIINGYTMHSMLALDSKDDRYSMIITANFIHRFRMMYIDSKNKKIQLYVSPSDSARHHRRDLQNFSRALKRHSEENQGKTGDGIPQEIIDLW